MPKQINRFKPSMWDDRAARLCEFICTGAPLSKWRAIEQELSIPKDTLWTIKYRRVTEVTVGQFFALVTAARVILERRRSDLNKFDAFISDLESEEAEKSRRLAATEQELSAVVHAAKALAREVD